MFILAYTAAIVYSSIYGSQSLLLVLRSEFGTSEATTPLMITSVLIPLGIAPKADFERLSTLAAGLAAKPDRAEIFGHMKI